MGCGLSLMRLESGGDGFRISVTTPLPQARLFRAWASAGGTGVFLKGTLFCESLVCSNTVLVARG